MLLTKDRSNRVYVSGPMTGLPDLNFPAFNALAYKMRQEGWKVLNPAAQAQIHGAKWTDYLRSDIALLAICDAIVLLPGWSKSKGASLEVHIAKELGMELILSEGAEEYMPGLIESAGEHVECHLEKQIDILRIDLESSMSREATLREELLELSRKLDVFYSRSHGIKNLSAIEEANDKAEALQQRLAVAEQRAEHWCGVSSEATCRAAALNDRVSELEELTVLYFDAEKALSDLKAKAKAAGTPPHSDYWHQSLYEAEKKVADAKAALKPVEERYIEPLHPVEGDKLPIIGSKVFIHLSSSDSWVEHTVAGYYAWGDLQGSTSLHRVFVRVRDSAGYLNARLLKDISLSSEGSQP